MDLLVILGSEAHGWGTPKMHQPHMHVDVIVELLKPYLQDGNLPDMRVSVLAEQLLL